MSLPTSDRHREKATRLIDYLLRIATLQSRLVRDVAGYERLLWLGEIPKQKGCYTLAWGQDEDFDPDIWIEIQTRREPELPSVPEPCKDWIEKSALRIKAELPELSSQRVRQIKNPDFGKSDDQPEFVSVIEYLTNYPDIPEIWNSYLEARWLPWAEDHNAWESVHKVYTALFAIHQEQLRLGEEYELVLGLGLLTWQTPKNQYVRRHLIVADVILEFEARLAKFLIRPHTEGAKLRPEIDMLEIEDQPPRAEEAARISLINAGDDPWDKGCVEGVLQALVHSISSSGEYLSSLLASGAKASEEPIVEAAPALILRKRSSKGLSQTLAKIRELIATGEEIPSEFADIAEINSDKSEDASDSEERQPGAFEGDVFFPKLSNDEQLRIVDRIRASNGVLVQGPPGTGKSHTIANLICHLLATGQRTLVTAKTPRALQVLEKLIPADLRPLCINLLGTGLEEKRSLESSVGGILRKNEEWNELFASKARKELEHVLRTLREESAGVVRRLRDIRESETHSQSIAEGSYLGTAARIAEAVNRDKSKFEWFVDIVIPFQTCPVSEDELHTVLGTLRYYSAAKRKELSLEWPESIPSPDRFSKLVDAEKRTIEEEKNLINRANEQIADAFLNGNTGDLELLKDAFTLLRVLLTRLSNTTHPWMLEALKDISGGCAAVWQELARATKRSIAEIETKATMADDAIVDIPENIIVKALYEDACGLRDHLVKGGKIGWGPFRPKAIKPFAYILKTIRINGRKCSTADNMVLLSDTLRVRLECERAWRLWSGRAENTQGAYVLQLHALKELQAALESALSFEGLIEECREAMLPYPALKEPEWLNFTKIDCLIETCRYELARQNKCRAVDEINKVEETVVRKELKANAHPVVREVLRAIQTRNKSNYENAYSTLRELDKEKQGIRWADEIYHKLYAKLPKLADELKLTSGESQWDERIKAICNAWNWAQAKYWINEYIRQEDLPSLVRRSKQIDEEILLVIAKLASLHAWTFCFSRLTEKHRRNMESWQQSIRRLGKGTGKHAPRYRREAQQHLNECYEAVPAWVMPLHRVWDTVDPSPGMFDVIIVDEASQCGLEGLPLLFLGKKILIVGDDKQISPEVGFIDGNVVFQLMEQFLFDYEQKSSFNRGASLFSHGKIRYGARRVTLCEHFRCMPEIIRFSNDLCYSDTRLIPLRQYGPARLAPIQRVFVKDGYREGSNSRAINRPEAQAIVNKIVELCRDSRYRNMTMGVIVLQGESQAGLIEEQLLDRIGADEMTRRRLICGNPYSFQGDERDIIFLSMVAASNERIGPLTKTADEQRFNVAASRARDQMWLFHSVTANDLSASCLRRRLLEFFENTSIPEIAGIKIDELERRAFQNNRNIIKPPTPFESWFEVDVALEILKKGFIVNPQFEVAGKRIDLVIEGGQARLAVECDGDHWHGVDKYEEDMQRQRQLERCGWEFYRVRESAFYADKNSALLDLWALLEERAIFPSMGSKKPEPEGSGGEPESGEYEENDDADNDEDDENSENEESADNDERSAFDSNRRTDEVAASEINIAIVQVLNKCPNNSCTVRSLASRVLKHLGILTRGNPRIIFERRVLRVINIMEEHGTIEKYKAKNNRIRLLKNRTEPQSRLF